MSDKPWLHTTSDIYGPARTRCPACGDFVTEGSKHKCRRGRHRNPFVDPATERKGS